MVKLNLVSHSFWFRYPVYASFSLSCKKKEFQNNLINFHFSRLTHCVKIYNYYTPYHLFTSFECLSIKSRFRESLQNVLCSSKEVYVFMFAPEMHVYINNITSNRTYICIKHFMYKCDFFNE